MTDDLEHTAEHDSWNDPEYRDWLKVLQTTETADAKICTGCWTIKPLSDFWKLKAGRKGCQAQCAVCATEKQRSNYAGGKTRDTRLKRLFGIGLDEYEALRQQQNGGCAICGRQDAGRRDNRLVVDHDHVTGAVRGLLCHRCNATLGMSGDSPERLETAARYLRGYSNKAALPMQSRDDGQSVDDL
jgi:hypothetical protein